MGKPSDLAAPKDDGGSLPTTPLVEGASSISMHRPNPNTAPHRQQYFDNVDNDSHFDNGDNDDDDDLPPLYTDHDLSIPPADPLIPVATPLLSISPWRSSSNSGKTYFIDTRLDTDPIFLKSQLAILAEHPPRPICHVRGTHTETVRRNDKDESKTVVDFDLEIELTSLLYFHTNNTTTQPLSPKQLLTVGNFEKVHRGTILTARAPGFGGSGAIAETGTPSIDEWCHRYCASAAGLKTFSLQRRVTGYDFDLLTTKLTSLIRSTNYLGHLSVQFPVHNARVDIYNSCRTSRWRLTKWIEILTYISLMFIFTWPWLFFRTKRWDTVYVTWPLRDEETGQYTTVSEEVWYNMWARAIQDAAVGRRQGILDQGDMQRANLLQENPPPLEGGMVGVIQAGVEAMGRVNRSFGWGADSGSRGRANRLSGLPNLGRRS